MKYDRPKEVKRLGANNFFLHCMCWRAQDLHGGKMSQTQMLISLWIPTFGHSVIVFKLEWMTCSRKILAQYGYIAPSKIARFYKLIFYRESHFDCQFIVPSKWLRYWTLLKIRRNKNKTVGLLQRDSLKLWILSLNGYFSFINFYLIHINLTKVLWNQYFVE